MEENNPPVRPNHLPSHGRPNRSITQRLIIWVLVLLAFAGLFVLVLTHKNIPQVAAQGGGRRGALAAGTVSVIPAVAQKGDIGVYQEAIGTVTPVYTSSITSQVTGQVIAVHYTEGQIVQKGDPLIDIDPRPFEAQLAQAQGTLAHDTHVLEQAQMDLERYRTAWANNAIAKQTLDDQEKTVLQDEGTVKADEGQVQYDQVQVAFCHIAAPFTGRAGLRLIDPGNVVQSNGTNPLVVITQEQPITVIFTLSEDALAQVQPQLRRGHRLTVEAWDRGAKNKLATGKLLTLDNQIDTTTGTVKLRAIFDNSNGALFPNQFVNTRLLVETLKNMTLVPTSTIQHNGSVSFVYLIQNGAALMRNVTPGVVEGGRTAVQGVQPGDVLANSSFEKLQPNVKVTVVKGSPPANPSGSTAP
jgi:multidrug efflux system membrane fusion protein